MAIRDRGDLKHTKLLRFLSSLTSSIESALDSWIAVPHDHTAFSSLFKKLSNTGRFTVRMENSSSDKELVERFIWLTCNILSIGQRCTD